MKPHLFVDLDGVLADFDVHFERLFGVRPNQDTYDPPEMWDLIRANGTFYRDLPLMPDARVLWQAVNWMYHRPTVLTGIPYSIPGVAEQKMLWVAEHLGPEVKVITCGSRLKCRYGEPGDILIDDRLKYAHYWTDMGGVFIHHTSARETMLKLGEYSWDPDGK